MTENLYLDDIKKTHTLKKIPSRDEDIETGYICFITEIEPSNNVYISFIRDINSKKILQYLQRGNPRKLKILRTFNRSSYKDASNICSFFRDSLILSQGFGNWYSVSPQLINRMLDEMFDSL